MNKLTFILMVFAFCTLGSMVAQDSIPIQDSIPAIRVIQKTEKDKVVLRWAPTSPISWWQGMKYGYKIERIRNIKASPEMNTFVTIAPHVMPWPKEQWRKEDVHLYDDYSLILAQMLYGESSERQKSRNWFSMAEDFESRYTISMMCADFSSQAADALGVRYEDRDVRPGFVYIYKITSLVPDSLLENEKSDIVVVDASRVDTLIKPEIHHIESGDRMLHIFWKKKPNIFNNYTAFYVERTEDGKAFIRLHDKPYISSNQFGEEFNEYFIYTDSIAKNYKNYGYRIIGISPFADLSPVSDVVFSKGRDLTPPPPAENITSSVVNGTVKISWQYPEDEGSLKGFFIGKSDNTYDGFENITLKILSKDTRSFTDTNPWSDRSNFYIVTSIDTSGNYSVSLAHYVHIKDTIPPSPPAPMSVEAFTNGNVLLTWRNNPELDVIGYEIHSAYHPDHVFIKVTNHQVLDTFYRDTVMVRSLTEKVYYKIVALDRSYNYSDYSEMIEVSLPDIVAPSSPVLYDFHSDKNGIKIFWYLSSSKDVTKQLVFRRESGEKDWTLIYETRDKQLDFFKDTLIKPQLTYFYKVHAADEANNMSDESTTVKVISNVSKIDYTAIHLKLEKLQGKNIIYWDKLPDVKYYTVYKTNHKGNFVTFEKTTDNKIVDVPEKRVVQYMIRATSISGITHAFCKPVTVK